MIRLGLLTLTALLLSGCAGLATKSTPIEVWPDMDRQHKFGPQSENPLFGDKRTHRLPVEGTVAIGDSLLAQGEAFHTGKQGAMYVGLNPLFPYDKATLEHGQRKFNTYCAPCHGAAGNGGGIVGKRAGPVLVPSSLINQDKANGVIVRGYSDGEIFDVVSNGRRTMKGYKNQVSPRDRWAIVAYVRVLQRQAGTLEDVPENLRSSLR